MQVMANRLVKIWNVGRIAFGPALKLQEQIVAKHRVNIDSNNDTILLVEHEPVYTIGIRTKDYSNEDIERLKLTGAEFYNTNRGGLITFHGPGQLVVYPIINLKNYQTSMRWYVCHIEKTIIHLCKKLGLKAETSPHTGVWIGNNKVCAIGVHGSKYITSHGLALNCNVDLSWFNHIVPCGIKDKGVTSLSKEIGQNIEVKEIIPLFIESFCNTFDCKSIEYESVS